VCLCVGFIGFVFWSRDQVEAQAPNFIGLNEAQVKERIKNQSFKIEFQTKSSSYKKGTIFKQSPTANTPIDQDTSIRLLISKGDLVRLAYINKDWSPKRAEERLNSLGFKTERKTVLEPGIPANTLLGSSPRPRSEVKPKSLVTLFISAQQINQVTIPNFKGKTIKSARSKNRGFRLVTVKKRISTKPPGTIISQQPSQGQLALEGSTIKVVISRASKKDRSVPNFIGFNKPDASTWARKNNIKLRYRSLNTDDPVEVGLVVKQKPTFKSRIKEKESVVVWVGF
jgi:serine/threonine-protein kinase